MSRTKKTVINILILAVTLLYVVTFALPHNGYFSSLEEMLELELEGLYYGECEKILKTYETPAGNGMAIGICDGYLAACEGNKVLLWWKMDDIYSWTNNSGLYKNGIGGFIEGVNAVCGYTTDTETVEVMYYANVIVSPEKKETIIDIVPVDENGFFFGEYYERFENEKVDGGYCVYLEGRDAEGNVIWTAGGYKNAEEALRMNGM